MQRESRDAAPSAIFTREGLGVRRRRVGKVRGNVPVESEKVLDQGPLESLFTGNATAKMLDFLSTFQEWDYSESDIAKNSGVNVRTVQRLIPLLEELGLVKQVRAVGRAKMYKLDKESEASRELSKFIFAVAAKRIRDIAEKGQTL